jgi:NAD dependent epimerase/dehydratase
MKLKGKKVLVTGAGGFIGSHLTDALFNNDIDVTAMVHYNSKSSWGALEYNKDLNVISGDITDASFVMESIRDKDVVFHLAALIGIPYSYSAPESYVNTNIKGTLNVMQACRDMGVERVIHTSTSEVYGTALYTPIDEDHPLQGQSPYSATKIGADKIAESYYCSFDTPVVTVRPFNTYGPRQSSRAIIPTIITQALVSDIVIIGSSNPVRDFTYVADTVNGFISIAKSDNTVGKIINIGYGRGISIRNLASRILSIANPKAVLMCDRDRIRPQNSEVMELVCDNTLIKALTPWKPSCTLDDGIRMTVDWIVDHIDEYKEGYTV